ncbi:efflux RND transporter periplasmic adaptor subunit [Prochlorococcus sp. MIT 0603]|uniref:efflux RND transporter periplasmic adaptor subunit n=1 Tax=unclassified Prochlorococcus TaxID=2627481 RepID=UPI0039A68C5C
MFARISPIEQEKDSSPLVVRPIEAVAALGQLSPSGEVRLLAAPITGFGGTPRISKLFITEGDSVKKGDVLAIFDNKPKILADLDISNARLNIINNKIISQKREISRYKESVLQGGSPKVILDERNDDLLELIGNKKEVLAEIKALEIDLYDSELKSPIDGMILKVNSREGERPDSDGVLEVGSSQLMEALIEVYESDINRVTIGQAVTLTSENGGFNGTLRGQVREISPQVRQRRVLATDPTGDADARIVEVRVSLEPSSALRVERFSGMKVIARFVPL